MSMLGIDVKSFADSLPYVRIVQSMSKEIQEGMDGWKVGDIALASTDSDGNKVTNKLPQGTEFILYQGWGQRGLSAPLGSDNPYLCFTPDVKLPSKQTPRGSTGRSCNASCPYYKWAADSCKEQYIVIAALVSEPTKLFRLFFSKTSYKVGTDFLTKLLPLDAKKLGLSVPFGVKFKLGTAKQKNAKGIYSVWEVTTTGVAMPDYEALTDTFEVVTQYKTSLIDSHYEGLSDGANQAAATVESAPSVDMLTAYAAEQASDAGSAALL